MTDSLALHSQASRSDAFRFYADLEQNNNRDWWLEHKPVYDAAVKGPLTAAAGRAGATLRPGQALSPQPGCPVLAGQIAL